MNGTGGPEPSTGARAFFEKYKGFIISGAVTVVVLAVVILVVSALGTSSPKQPALNFAGAPSATDQLLSQAQSAAQSGDTTSAAELARAALAADPNNAKAKALLDTVQEQPATDTAQPGTGSTGSSTNTGSGTGGSGGGSSNNSGSNPPVPLKPGDPNAKADAGFTSKIGDIAALLPKSFSGYDLGRAAPLGSDVTLAGTASSSSAAASHVLWAVHDMSTQKGAAGFITKTSSVSYGQDKSTVSIDGAVAFFGTDGTRFATVAYTRGRYVFEVVVTGNDVPPASLKSFAAKAAAAFPDTPPK